MNRRADRPVMFRAGGETRGIPALSADPVTYLADLSEFEPSLTDPVYLAWSKAIVIRAMYGDQHDDNAWYGGARRDALHAGGAKFVGIYQYLVAAQDAAAQAHALVRLVGRLRPGEKLIADIEEGDGDQAARWRQWCGVLAAAYGTADGADPWDYSGLDFAATHGLKPQWVAAYQGNEPATPHLLWQFTPSFPVPGVGLADCSVFHGSIDELAAYAYQPAPPPKPPKPVKPGWTAAMIKDLPVLKQGDQDKPGEFWHVHRLQALLAVTGSVKGISEAAGIAADGAFGAKTAAAVRAIEAAYRLPVTGTSVPAVWSVLLTGVAG